MKVLLTGGSGQIGFEVQRAIAPVAELVAPGFGGLPRLELADFAAVESLVAAVGPDLVINAAAYTAVDKAESEPALAALINAEAPGVLARAAARLSAPMIHYSTDYVFDGSGVAPWREEDAAHPLNVYGVNKLAGEIAVRAANPHHLILRTSWVYSSRGINFARTMLRLAGERETLQVVNDQFGAPTAAGLVADATVQAARHAARTSQLYGTYHLVASGETSWHDYAAFLLRGAFEHDLIDRLPRLEAVISEQFPTPANRPKNSRLCNEKFARGFDFSLPDWRLGVEQLIATLAKAAM